MEVRQRQGEAPVLDVRESRQIRMFLLTGSLSMYSACLQCYLGTKSVGTAENVLAAFTPPPLVPRADGRPAPAATLKLFPQGQEFLDHIVMSTLILERRRLSSA